MKPVRTNPGGGLSGRPFFVRASLYCSTNTPVLVLAPWET
jgi:hypothetical protein